MLNVSLAREHVGNVYSLYEMIQFLLSFSSTSRCGCSWFYSQWNHECKECGIGAMIVPCPICGGRCGGIFTRDVDMSHAFRAAHWDGACGLPQPEQLRLLFQQTAMTEDSLADAFADAALDDGTSNK